MFIPVPPVTGLEVVDPPLFDDVVCCPAVFDDDVCCPAAAVVCAGEDAATAVVLQWSQKGVVLEI